MLTLLGILIEKKKSIQTSFWIHFVTESHLYNCVYIFCIIVIVMYSVSYNKILFKHIWGAVWQKPGHLKRELLANFDILHF